MCGICGVVLADPSRIVARATIEKMCDTIAHRGPDDRGVFVDGAVGLGHQRLSIVDLANGHQPKTNEDESICLVFNGEIYNYRDYVAPLRQRGHIIRTRSDTEVLVHLHEESPTNHLAELRGMFAYGAWNARSRNLTLVRDHSGIKPLFYAINSHGDLVFASEIKAILASGIVDAQLNAEALPAFFALGHVPGEGTLYRGILRLPAGHVLSWREGRITTKRYWNLPTAPAASRLGRTESSIASAADDFWSRFTDSVRSQLMADVPLGVFLSGGLDSSLIVAAMRAVGVDRISSFSVGFSEESANELPFARIAANAFQTKHNEVVISSRDFFEALPVLTAHRDQPLSFSASIPLYFVSSLARESVKVVLTGEGSDELFAGYGRYPRALLNRRLGHLLDTVIPAGARSALASLVRRLPDDYVGNRLKRSFLARRGNVEEACLEPFAEFDQAHRAALLGDGNGAYGGMTGLLSPDLLSSNPLEFLLRLDQATYLEELLMKQDQMSMAASIESRVPFLDHRLVEWAGQLPPQLKLNGAIGKSVVRRAAANRIPRSIVAGKKLGFLVPLDQWLRGIGRQWIEEYAPAADDPVVNRSHVLRLIDEHNRGRNHTGRLWRLLAFQVWRRQLHSPHTSRIQSLGRDSRVRISA